MKGGIRTQTQLSWVRILDNSALLCFVSFNRTCFLMCFVFFLSESSVGFLQEPSVDFLSECCLTDCIQGELSCTWEMSLPSLTKSSFLPIYQAVDLALTKHQKYQLL